MTSHTMCRNEDLHTNNCVEVAYTHPEKKRLNLPASTLGRSGWLPNHSQTLNGQAAVPLELLAKHFVKRSQFHNNGQRFRTIVYISHVIHWSTLCVYLLRHVFHISTCKPQVITFYNLPQNIPKPASTSTSTNLCLYEK